ncbi:short chain dehydrogenase [Candidatus Nanopelagicaceae bacterium]
MKNGILFGATSEIGIAIVQECLKTQDWQFFTAGSKPTHKSFGSRNLTHIFIDWAKVKPIDENLFLHDKIPLMDFVIVSLGFVSQTEEQLYSSEIVRSISANLTWPLICIDFLNRNKRLSDDAVIVIVSSALVNISDNRKSFVYTHLKSTLEYILKSAHRHELMNRNIIFLRPGFVPTKLNRHLKSGKFAVGVEDIAQVLIQRIRRGKKSGVVYAPTRLALLANLIRIFPKRIQRKILRKLQNM